MLLATTILLAALATPQATDTTLPAAKGTRLAVNNFVGRITVTAWPRNEVQVRSTSTDDEAELRVESSAGEIRVSQRMRYGPTEMDVTISAPAWMAVNLQGTDTDMIVSGIAAPVRAQSVSGDITVSGGVDNISLSSVDGDVSADGTRGTLDIQAVDGDVTVRNLTGALSIQGVDGDLRLEGITSSSVRVSSVDGDIAFDGPLAASGNYSFKTHDGDLTLRPAGTVNATVSVSTWNGEFESSFPVTITGSHEGKRFSFTLGTGSARVELESFDGQIRLVH